MTSPADPTSKRTTTAAFWLLIGLIASIGAGKAILSDTLDPDLFWHLRVAEQLRTDGIGPIVDRLSFSSIKEPWTPYSWLAELVMEWQWNHLGWRSAVAMKAILVAAIIVVIALGCLALAGKDRRLNCVLATAFGAYLTIPFLSYRPATFAILLLGICALLLLRDRKSRDGRWLVWLIVPITILITNIHLSAIVVPIWVGCLLTGAIIIERRDVKHYAALLFATSLSCLATPMLAGAVRTAWFYQAQDVMVNSKIIAEMQPIYGGFGIITLVLLIALICTAFVNRRHLRVGEWLWLGAAIAMTLRLGRFAPMLAFIAAPVMAATLPAMSDRALRKPLLTAVLGIILLLSLARMIAGFPGGGTMIDLWVNRHLAAFPTAAAKYVEESVPPRRGRLINEFNWGGYLAWRLGDRYQVFLDGRTQLFTPEFWKKTYLGSDQDATDAVRAADADVAIIPKRRSQFRKSLETLGWRSVYRDDIAEVLLPPQ